MVTKDGHHLPPKYTISRAHQVATGELLPWNQFHGGRESNEFLRRLGFVVTKCNNCRGSSVRDAAVEKMNQGRPEPASGPKWSQRIPLEFERTAAHKYRFLKPAGEPYARKPWC